MTTGRDVHVWQLIRVVIDEEAFTPAFMAEFRASMYPFEAIDEHIEHLGQLYARGLVNEFSDFIEGYGPPQSMGIQFFRLEQEQEVIQP